MAIWILFFSLLIQKKHLMLKRGQHCISVPEVLNNNVLRIAYNDMDVKL